LLAVGCLAAAWPDLTPELASNRYEDHFSVNRRIFLFCLRRTRRNRSEMGVTLLPVSPGHTFSDERFFQHCGAVR